MVVLARAPSPAGELAGPRRDGRGLSLIVTCGRAPRPVLHRPLGATGFNVSVVGFGAGRVGDADLDEAARAAVSRGNAAPVTQTIRQGVDGAELSRDGTLLACLRSRPRALLDCLPPIGKNYRGLPLVSYSPG